MNHYSMDELEIGKEERFTVCITEDMQKTFMELTGDVNPLHLDIEVEHRSEHVMFTVIVPKLLL